ncbi:hypothetical protein LguiB_001835 [Lonicera macranthoides]
MECMELMPLMCKWKAQQCSEDTRTALTVLRETIDDLTKIYGAIFWWPVEENSSVTHEALKMLLDARKTEKAQGNMPTMESRTKRRHEPTNTIDVAKGKALEKKNQRRSNYTQLGN